MPHTVPLAPPPYDPALIGCPGCGPHAPLREQRGTVVCTRCGRCVEDDTDHRHPDTAACGATDVLVLAAVTTATQPTRCLLPPGHDGMHTDDRGRWW